MCMCMCVYIYIYIYIYTYIYANRGRHPRESVIRGDFEPDPTPDQPRPEQHMMLKHNLFSTKLQQALVTNPS